MVKNSDNEPVLTITMREGEITLVGLSHAATSSIRWRTAGLTLTRERISTTATTKGHTGPGPVSDAYGSGHAVLMFDNAFEKTDVKSGDIVTTTIKFSAAQVQAALGVDFENITRDTMIYLHGIFETYDYNAQTDTRKPRKTGLNNWTSIMDAETWGSSTLDDFAKYFNMQIEFKPAPQQNTLYSVTINGTVLNSKSLESVLPGDSVYWNNEPEIITVGTIQYSLTGYYVTKKSDPAAVKLTNHYIGDSDGCTLADIRSNRVQKVRLGGMNVFLVYKEAPVITPTPTPTPKLSITPTPTPLPDLTPLPSPTPIIPVQSDSLSADMNIPLASGSIRADNRGSEKFTVNAGVPTTESLFTNVMSDKYLMGYNLKKQTGIDTYSVKVTKNYILKWKGKNASGTTDMSETVIVEKYVSIQRAYGYWEILNFDLYQIGRAEITNYALPGGKTTMTPNYSAGYSVPAVTSVHSASKTDHIIIPNEINNGIVLPAETISVDSMTKPSIPREDLGRLADDLIPELKVKNDTLILNGTPVMSPDIKDKEGPQINSLYLTQIRAEGFVQCNNNVLYKSGQIIDAVKKNGTYYSSGIITYNRVNSINSHYSNEAQYNIVNLESVVIHTPVLCEAIVTADNDKYVQLLDPTSAVQLVLDQDPALNDFTLQISNYGFHHGIQGYFTRDFSRSLRDPENVSYIASKNGILVNEVKFPFDVYIKKSGNEDDFVKKNTWIILGRNTVTFYLPMWVQEGTYTALCRTVAVNADMVKLDQISEERVNSKLINYVATDEINFEVSGRLYGLTIYDLTDYPMWQEAFRVKNSLQLKLNSMAKYPDGTNKTTYNKNYSYYYTVGTNDQYGIDSGRNVKYTFPLVNGSHPYYTNIGVMKTGYVVRFKAITIGTLYGSGCRVRIKPSFYYVDKNGQNRTRVDIYYEEDINGDNRSLVKIGSSLDKLNVKYMEAGNPYLGIPEQELRDTAAIMNKKYTSLLYQWDTLMTFSWFDILSTFRTFTNKAYTGRIANSSQLSKISAAGITQNDVMKQMQTWYSCYYLPGIMHVVDPKDVPNGWTVYEYADRKGITYKEDWWKKDGYIIVNFDIVTIDSQGNERLSYINADNYLQKGNCSMWTMEGAPLSKKDNKGVTFNFKAGDFIIYHVNKSIQGDYSSGGLY